MWLRLFAGEVSGCPMMRIIVLCPVLLALYRVPFQIA